MPLHFSSNPVTAFTLGACLLFAWDPTEAFAEILEKQAYAIADKAMVKHRVHAPPWVSKVEKDLEDWHRTRASWEKRIRVVGKSQFEAIQARIGKIEYAIKGKDVWLVIYRYPEHSAQRTLHTHAIVFLDSQTGDVLEIIHREE
jgi:predicted GH43/DUF377 family glycosyl hydrolase